MTSPALKQVPRVVPTPPQPITVKDLPWREAANTDVEVIESFAQKFLRVGGKLLGHALFYAQFLEFEGDNPRRTPIIDQPPEDKTIPQWLAEIEENTRIAIDIANKQAEIYSHQMNGQQHLLRQAQEELEQLVDYAQTIQRGASTPITGGALKMVASAGGTAPLSPADKEFLNDSDREADDSPHLDAAQRKTLKEMIAGALAGSIPVVDIARYKYNRLRDTAPHPLYDGNTNFGIGAIRDALLILDPTGEAFPYDEVPTFDTLMARANFKLEGIIFTTRETPRDELNRLHSQGKSVWCISLTKDIPFSHSGGKRVHPIVYAMHDFWHLLTWFTVSLETRHLATLLYTHFAAIEAETEYVAKRLNHSLDLLAELNYIIRNNYDLLTRLYGKMSEKLALTAKLLALPESSLSYLNAIQAEIEECPHLDATQRAALKKVIAEVTAGDRPVVDVARHVYELRREISARSGKRDSILMSIQASISGLLAKIDPGKPGFGYRIPAFDELLKNANFSTDDVVFTTRPSTRNELNQLHAQGKSVWLISLADAIPSNHGDKNVDGTTFALHDYFHLLDWFSAPAPIRLYAATLYTLIEPVVAAHGVADEFDLYLDRLIELGEDYRLMKLVVRFPLAMVEGLILARHSVIPAIYNVLKSHTWGEPYAAQQRDATDEALGKLTNEATAADWDIRFSAWEALAQSSPMQFLQAANDRNIAWKQEITQHIDRGENAADILQFYHIAIEPELGALKRAFRIVPCPTMTLISLRHDASHRLDDLNDNIPYFLKEGDLARVRSICNTNPRKLKLLFAQVQFLFGNRVMLYNTSPNLKFEVASNVDIDALIRIVENLIRNAGDHPREGQDTVPVTMGWSQDGRTLVIEDFGTGMDEATVQKLRDNVRIHNGQEATSGEHGFGWQSIRENCEKLGIQWQIHSVPNHTTIILALPEGFLQPTK